MVGEGSGWITLWFTDKTNGFLFSSQPLCTFLILQTDKAVNALLCCLALTHTSCTFIIVRSAVVEEMSSGYVMTHANKKYIYQVTSQSIMLHKPNSRVLWRNLIEFSRGWVSLIIWVSLGVADCQMASLASVSGSQQEYVIWCDGFRHLNHRSLSYGVDKTRWRQAKLSYLAGWAEGDKPGSAHSKHPQCFSAWCRAGWTGW